MTIGSRSDPPKAFKSTILSYMREVYETEMYTPLYPWSDPVDNRTVTAMFHHGGFVVPWGCDTQ